MPGPGEGSAPWGCLVLGGVCSREVPGPRGVSAPGGCLVETPPTATAAGGTHPTGMHSCNCCDMGQNDTIGKIELIPAFVLSKNKTNC